MVHLSYFGRQNIVLETMAAKIENLLFLPYNHHFLLHKHNYDARIHI